MNEPHQTQPASRRLLTIVTPVYNEQDNVGPVHEAVKKLFEEQLPEYDYEHLFTDNHSTGQTIARRRGDSR